jgi:hypothetical protein
VFLVNPSPLLFKAPLRRQKDRVFFQRAFNLHTKSSTLERLGLQGTFKSRALWSVRDGKGLNWNKDVVFNKVMDFHIPLGRRHLHEDFWHIVNVYLLLLVCLNFKLVLHLLMQDCGHFKLHKNTDIWQIVGVCAIKTESF